MVRAAVLCAVGAGTLAAQAPGKDSVIAAARDVMTRARYATLGTVSGAQPAARVVDPQAPDRDLTVWIATNPATRKVEEIRKNPRVSLMYFDATGLEYAMLAGTATIVSDRAEIRRHWKAEWKPFYAKGPDGDDIILLRVRPTRVEVVSPKHKLVNDAKTWRPVGVDLP
jgi:general stress protein 26